MRLAAFVHSFAGDDPLLCRDYVRERLRLPGWRPKAPKECRLTSATEKCRIATALSIFQTAVNARGTIVEAYLQIHVDLKSMAILRTRFAFMGVCISTVG